MASVIFSGVSIPDDGELQAMYGNDYSAYPQIFGSVIGIAVIAGSLLAFIPSDTLRRLCAKAYALLPALVVIYVLAEEQVTDIYVFGLSVPVTLFFMTVWGLPALVSYKLVRHYLRRRFELRLSEKSRTKENLS